MLEVVLLAIALSMDAFAVSISLGATESDARALPAIKAGLFFGLSQALMPLIGYFAGEGLLPLFKDIDHWIAFTLLALIGGKMVYESFNKDINRVTTRSFSLFHQTFCMRIR